MCYIYDITMIAGWYIFSWKIVYAKNRIIIITIHDATTIW